MFYEGVAKGLFDITLTRDGFVPSTASSLVVKEQRGEGRCTRIPQLSMFLCSPILSPFPFTLVHSPEKVFVA